MHSVSAIVVTDIDFQNYSCQFIPLTDKSLNEQEFEHYVHSLNADHFDSYTFILGSRIAVGGKYCYVFSCMLFISVISELGGGWSVRKPALCMKRCCVPFKFT